MSTGDERSYPAPTQHDSSMNVNAETPSPPCHMWEKYYFEVTSKRKARNRSRSWDKRGKVISYPTGTRVKSYLEEESKTTKHCRAGGGGGGGGVERQNMTISFMVVLGIRKSKIYNTAE